MSEVKVNKISPRTNCGTVQLGDSGDTITIPAGASITNSGTASGFGATGAVSWNTTVKTSGFTAVAGEGYFVNTTSGAISVNLPAGTAGAVVGFKDYAKTFDTNACTLVQNGSDKIAGDTTNAKLSIEGQAVTLVFIDSTQGWLVTDSGLQSDASQARYVTGAVSGSCNTLATAPCGDYKIATFKGPGNFTVSCAGNPVGSNTVEYLVAAGGGGGSASCIGGAGGAGGFRFASPSLAPVTYPAKPLTGSTLPVSVQAYPITVGAGGAGSVGPGSPPGTAPPGTSGNTSTFSTISSAGGGGGGSSSPSNGVAGGSGGGGAYNGCGGAGNTPPVSPSQGNAGGSQNPPSPGPGYGAGGGGGATAAGTSGNGTVGGPGGAGAGVPNLFGITVGQNCGSNYYFSGGGGGASEHPSTAATGGLGGGGNGGFGAGSAPSANRTGTAGTANTGGGGGGAGGSPSNTSGSTGGSGIVIIRYKFQ